MKSKNNSTKTPSNHYTLYRIVNIVYFVFMLIIIYFMFNNESKVVDTMSIVLFLGYFILLFFLGYKLKMNKRDIFLKPFKTLIMIMGVVYLFEFSSTGVLNLALINVTSTDAKYIKESHNEMLSDNNIKIYFNKDTLSVFLVDDNRKYNNIYKFEASKETDFDKSLLEDTMTFYSLNESVKFSYLVGNTNNEIVIQITDGEERYLSLIDGTTLIDLLQEKDIFSTLLYDNKDYAIFIDKTSNVMAYFDKETFSVSEFDKLANVSELNYVERGYYFLRNHFEEEYLEMENMSLELVTEKIVNNDFINKINFYSVRAESSFGFYGFADVVEVIYNDGSSVIGMLRTNTEVIKESENK